MAPSTTTSPKASISSSPRRSISPARTRSPSTDLLDHATTVFRASRERLAELLRDGGLGAKDAARFAAILIAGTEGAVVLSRAEQSMEPFELMAEQLLSEVSLLSARSN